MTWTSSVLTIAFIPTFGMKSKRPKQKNKKKKKPRAVCFHKGYSLLTAAKKKPSPIPLTMRSVHVCVCSQDSKRMNRHTKNASSLMELFCSIVSIRKTRKGALSKTCSSNTYIYALKIQWRLQTRKWQGVNTIPSDGRISVFQKSDGYSAFVLLNKKITASEAFYERSSESSNVRPTIHLMALSLHLHGRRRKRHHLIRVIPPFFFFFQLWKPD